MDQIEAKLPASGLPSFVEPVRRFTDRDVPEDIMAQLGARGGSVVREWRAKRQMAEGAGNQFEVKTDRPAPPPDQ